MSRRACVQSPVCSLQPGKMLTQYQTQVGELPHLGLHIGSLTLHPAPVKSLLALIVPAVTTMPQLSAAVSAMACQRAVDKLKFFLLAAPALLEAVSRHAPAGQLGQARAWPRWLPAGEYSRVGAVFGRTAGTPGAALAAAVPADATCRAQGMGRSSSSRGLSGWPAQPCFSPVPGSRGAAAAAPAGATCSEVQGMVRCTASIFRRLPQWCRWLGRTWTCCGDRA